MNEWAIYKDEIEKARELVNAVTVQELDWNGTVWNKVTNRSMILRSDMAYELGGAKKYGIGLTLCSEDDPYLDVDRVFLRGKDLPELTADSHYARVALVKIKKDNGLTGEKLYSNIRAIEYTRHHVYPEGFMMRVSSSQNVESIRIGKDALKKGLTFAKAGKLMIEEFHKHPLVEAVHLYYITEEEFPYQELKEVAAKSERITRTIDHMLKNAGMDCNVCNLQEVCDEVEGLRELHFGMKG